MNKQKKEVGFTPNKKEIMHFVSIFHKLSEFEAIHRLMRGWGLFKEKDLPNNTVVKVLAWLKEITSNG